jgi:hypothetical protein
MFLETYSGAYIEVDRRHLENASREELISFLESRGSACYDDESTTLLRECALDDYDSEYDGSPR